MKNLQDILTQITSVTTNIETNYPELYKFLGENPVTIPSTVHPNINIAVMQDYLESLKLLLKQYIKTHKEL